MNLNDLLKMTFEKKASDLHVKVGVPPILRIDGRLVPLETEKRTTQEDALTIALSIMNNAQKARFKEKNELDMAYAVPGLGRFRVNVFQQRGSVGMVFRMVPAKILNFEDLMLPPVLQKIAERAARSHPGDRDDRKRQVHDPGGHDRLHQHRRGRPTSSPSRTPSSSCTGTRRAS